MKFSTFAAICLISATSAKTYSSLGRTHNLTNNANLSDKIIASPFGHGPVVKNEVTIGETQPIDVLFGNKRNLDHDDYLDNGAVSMASGVALAAMTIILTEF